MNSNKIFVVLLGMAVLAGLAYHQGGVKQASSREESMLVGTALESPDETAPSAEDSATIDQSGPGDCMGVSQAPTPESAGTGDCTTGIASDASAVDVAGDQGG